jgi:hypothetical protein
MNEWQYRAAFVIQFRAETDVAAGRFEGRVEHIASTRAKQFHSLEELIGFIANILAEIRNTQQKLP